MRPLRSISLHVGRSRRRAGNSATAPLLSSLDRDVLVGPGVSEGRDEVEPGLADTRSERIEEGELPYRCVYRLVVDELLHLGQDPRAPVLGQFDRLFLEEFVDVGVAAVGIGAVLDDKGREPRCGIAEGTAAPADDVLEFL